MFRPKLPVNEETREFIDAAFSFFESIYGYDTFLEFSIILPTLEFFAQKSIESYEDVTEVFNTVCQYMKLDSKQLNLVISFHQDITEKMKGTGKYEESGAAGMYYESDGSKRTISLAVNQEDTLSLVATMAHELSHHILLGSGHMSSADERHEYYTDLLTIYLGFAVFTSHAAFQTAGFTSGIMGGWYSRSTGYLSLRSIGYATALYGFKKGITGLEWERSLPRTVKQYYDNSLKWLRKSLN